MAEASVAEDAPHRTGVDLTTGVVVLLGLATFINYVDRGSLPTAAPLLKDQLHLTNTQVGMLISAFFWTYTFGQTFSGWVADRINPYRTLAIGLAVWSLATALMSAASGFLAILLLRLAMGVGESASFPCTSKLFAQHLPPGRLGGANGVVSVGLALGPGFGAVVGGLMMARAGWRPVFLTFGLASLLWLIPWTRVTARAARAADAAPPAVGPSYARLLRIRSLWGAGLGHFASNYMYYFMISWLPFYLVKSRGLTMTQMAEFTGAIYVIHAAFSQATGWVSDRWMAAGASSTRVRKTFAVTAHLGSAACLAVCAAAPLRVAMAALIVSGVFSGFTTPTIFAIGQSLGGPRGGGRWISLQNTVGNCAGVLGPIITGFVVDRTGQFMAAFVIAAAVGVIGAACWGLVVGKVEPQNWGSPD